MKAKEPIPVKFMRPRVYAKRIGANWRTMYRYIDQGMIPAHKFQGLVLIDVEKADNIIKELGVSQPIVGSSKVGRPRKTKLWRPIERMPLAIGWQPEFY